jgi:hypothetical protein
VALDIYGGEDSMTVRSVLWGAVAAAALVATMLGTAEPIDAATSCARNFYYGRARGVFYTTTGISARAEWRSNVRASLGNGYAFWSRATSRSTRCKKPEGSGGTWSCVSRAVPCRY